MAVVIQAARPPPTGSPVSVPAASRVQPPKPQRRMSGKENLPQGKPLSETAIGANIKSRRERPCDACRRRKSRCVIPEGNVLCVLCVFHKQECTFVQDPQPRKRKVAGEGDKSKEAGSPKKRFIDHPPRNGDSPPQKLTNHRHHHPSQRTPARIENHVLGETLGLQSTRHARHIGLTSAFDPILVALSRFDHRGESTFCFGTLRKVDDRETFIMMSDEDTSDYGNDIDAVQEINQVVAPHGPALLDLYFRIVHPSFPIIQKNVYLERYRTSGQNMAPALLAGVYIMALNWWSHDPELANKPRPDVAQLEAIASRSLSAAMQRPKLSTVQAGLVLLQRPQADSWSLTTQLVAIAQELGLHLDSSAWSIPPWERGLRKRIAWALYMQDKWSSLIHGRPSHIFAANWAVKPLSESEADIIEDSGVNTEDNEEDKQDVEQGFALFTQMISLTGILAEIMDTFYTQVAIQDFNNAGRNSTRLILERAKPVQIKLRDWFASLPASLRMDNVTPKKLSSTGFLHLAYFATEITLHRRIVQSLTAASDAYLTYICRSAAKTRLITAMDFVNRLRPEHLQAFWYFPSKINFTLIGTFGGLLWATAPAREEADFYRLRLREYRWTLSVSSERADFLDYAVQMLDTSRHMLKNLVEKPALAQQVSSAGVPDREAVLRTTGRLSPSGITTHRGDVREEDLLMARPSSSSVSATAPGRPVSLSRVTSASQFSGFSDGALDLSTNEGSERRSPNTTPPSSVA